MWWNDDLGGEDSPTATSSTTDHTWSRRGQSLLSDFVHVESESDSIQTEIHISPIAYDVWYDMIWYIC